MVSAGRCAASSVLPTDAYNNINLYKNEFWRHLTHLMLSRYATEGSSAKQGNMTDNRSVFLLFQLCFCLWSPPFSSSFGINTLIYSATPPWKPPPNIGIIHSSISIFLIFLSYAKSTVFSFNSVFLVLLCFWTRESWWGWEVFFQFIQKNLEKWGHHL